MKHLTTDVLSTKKKNYAIKQRLQCTQKQNRVNTCEQTMTLKRWFVYQHSEWYSFAVKMAMCACMRECQKIVCDDSSQLTFSIWLILFWLSVKTNYSAEKLKLCIKYFSNFPLIHCSSKQSQTTGKFNIRFFAISIKQRYPKFMSLMRKTLIRTKILDIFSVFFFFKS